MFRPAPDDNVLVRGVAGDTDALGYFGYAYFKANDSTLTRRADSQG